MQRELPRTLWNCVGGTIPMDNIIYLLVADQGCSWKHERMTDSNPEAREKSHVVASLVIPPNVGHTTQGVDLQNSFQLCILCANILC